MGMSIRQKGVGRRPLLAGMLAAPALIGGQARAQAGRPLNFLTWGGGFGRAVRGSFSDPYTAATGVEVRDITPFNYGRFVTAMQNRNPENFDLAWFSDEVEPAQAGAQGLLEKLDFALLPNVANALPSARTDFGVSPYITVYQIGHRTDLWPTAPTSWADFWDVAKFPGPRSLGSWVGGVLEAALMADGVAPADLYPLDEERAYRKLNEIRPHVRVFHNTSAAQPVRQMLYQNEVAMVLTWSTDFIAANRAGRPVNVVWNQGFYFSPLVGIAKGSANTRAAHDYLNRMFAPDALTSFVKSWPTTPSVPAIAERLTESERGLSALGNLERMVNLSRPYYLEHRERLQRRYDTWRVV